MAQPRPPDTSASGMRPPATCPGLGLCTILPLLPRVVGPQAPGPLRHCGHGAPPAPRASGRQPRWLRHRPLRLSLGGVQHHDDHVRRASHCDHLSASAFPWSGGGGGHAVTRAGRCGAQTPVLIDLPWTLPHATPGWHVSRTPCCLAHGDVLQEETGLTTGEERCAPPTPRAGGEHPPTSAHSTRQAVPRSRCGPPAAHERHSGFAQTHRAVSSQHVTRLPLEISYRKEPGSQHRRRGCRR